MVILNINTNRVHVNIYVEGLLTDHTERTFSDPRKNYLPKSLHYMTKSLSYSTLYANTSRGYQCKRIRRNSRKNADAKDDIYPEFPTTSSIPFDVIVRIDRSAVGC